MWGKFFCTFFLWESQGHFLGDKDQIHLGRAKGSGKRGYGGEAKNKGYFHKIPIIQQDTNLSHKLLVRQTSNHHHCDQHAQNHKQVLSNDFEQFLLVKNNSLTSVHNDVDATNDYNRVIGIAQLNAFSCANNIII